MQFDGGRKINKNDLSWPNFGDLLTTKCTAVELTWVNIVAVLHICHKMNFDWLCEVVDTSLPIIIDKFQYFWQPFWILPPKKFSPRGTFGYFWYVVPHWILHHISHFPALYKFPPGLTLFLPDYYQKYPRVYTRTKRYCSFIHCALNYYQDSISNHYKLQLQFSHYSHSIFLFYCYNVYFFIGLVTLCMFFVLCFLLLVFSILVYMLYLAIQPLGCKSIQ